MATRKRSKEDKPPRAVIDGVPVWCGHDAVVPIDELMPHPKNDNKHPEEQIARLAKIIASSGWRACITVSTLSGCITKGHGRLLAAVHAGFGRVPVEYQDYPDTAAELADLLADNHIAELSVFDDAATALLIDELKSMDVDIELAGFDPVELTNMDPDDDETDDAGRDLIDEIYSIVIECEDEAEQVKLLERLEKEGIRCRALIS